MKRKYVRKQFISKHNFCADLLFVDIVESSGNGSETNTDIPVIVINALQYKGPEMKVPLKAISKTLDPGLLL